jgi:single-strand DNA-binding protein
VPGVGDTNEVHLTGRVSGAPERRTLPSGDEVASFRIVVRREPGGPTRVTVDTIDIACWGGRTRRRAGTLAPDDVVEVRGALRRRFFRTPGGPRSRYEVEASTIRRLAPKSRPPAGHGRRCPSSPTETI